MQTLRKQMWISDRIDDLILLESAECLTRLKQLHLRFQCFEIVNAEDGMRKLFWGVIQFFRISHLQALEHLTFEGGFDLAWCPTLASLKRLKCFKLGITKRVIGCTIGEQFYELGAFPQ